MTNKFRDALELFPRTGSSVETLGRFQFDFTSTIKQALTIAAAAQDDPVNILIDALKFYATKEHWMAQTEDGDRLLLVAKGQSSLDHGWAEAHSAMQRYAIAAHYHLTPKTQSEE